MAKKYTTGAQQMIAKLDKVLRHQIQTVVNVVEATARDVANHAAQDHGLDAHEQQRYVNRTSNLTQSMQASPAKVTGSEVTANASAGMDYAPDVELGVRGQSRPYPFLFPALVANAPRYKQRLAKIGRKE